MMLMNQVIALPRGGGKTKLLVEWFLDRPGERGVACFSTFEAERVHALAVDLARDRGWTPDEIREQIPRRAFREFGQVKSVERTWAIDNLDTIMEIQFKKLGPVTYTP